MSTQDALCVSIYLFFNKSILFHPKDSFKNSQKYQTPLFRFCCPRVNLTPYKGKEQYVVSHCERFEHKNAFNFSQDRKRKTTFFR